MKKILLIVLGVLIGGALYVYLDPALKHEAGQQVDKLTGQDQTRILYRWQNAERQWQVTDFPPPQGTPYETLRYDTDANVIPSENLTGQKN